jgi:hypothetical protein
LERVGVSAFGVDGEDVESCVVEKKLDVSLSKGGKEGTGESWLQRVDAELYLPHVSQNEPYPPSL